MEDRKERKLLKRAAAAAIAWMLLISATLTTGTYAWFTSNARVETDMITVHTKKFNDLTLELSKEGGAEFASEENLVPVQVNKHNMMALMPVSTADLKTFVTCVNNAEDENAVYAIVENEELIYHGRFYFRVRSDYTVDKRVMVKMNANPFKAIEEGGEKFPLLSEEIFRAVRLGIVIDDEDGGLIMADKATYPGSDYTTTYSDTYLNGERIKEGFVLNGSGEAITAVPDPCYPALIYSEETEETIGLEITDLNEIHKVDIYVYLEGCDPDCMNDVQKEQIDFSLELFGDTEFEIGGKE